MKSCKDLILFSFIIFMYSRVVFQFQEDTNDDGDLIARPQNSIVFPPIVKRPIGARRLAEYSEAPSDLTIATYNLWNIMFHWEVRKVHIADMIETHDIDVIGFQEVRANKANSHNQLHDLQELLHKHKYLLYHPTHVVSQTPELHPPGWELEGIGLLSKYRILSYHVLNLTLGRGMDPIQRSLLSAQILVDGHEVTVIVTHFSYDRKAQCNNAWDVLKYLHSAGAEKMILLGDFNVYNEYHWPMELLLTSKIDVQGPAICQRIQRPWFHGHADYEFVDAWTEVNPHSPGFTFSNMPDPGLHSRPDRILVSKPGFKVDSTFKLGRGWEYRDNYKKSLHLARLHAIYKSAQRQLEGNVFESSCYWDCGPHGMCRCGICVPKRDDKCDESYCNICGPARLRYYQFLQGFFLLALATFFFSLGICISKPVCGSMRAKSCAKLQRSFVTSRYFVLCTIIMASMLYAYFKWTYSDVLELANSQIAEELYPSDHMMVVVRMSLD